MAIKVLVRENPRIVSLATESHALIFRHFPSTSESSSSASYANIISPRCVVQFGTVDSLDLSGYRTLGHGHGTLGLITLAGDVFLCVITNASRIATIRPGETVNRINTVEFYCLNRSDYDNDLDYEIRSLDRVSIEDSDHEFTYDPRENSVENRFQNLKKLLDDGSFYYSVDFNLTNRLQDRTGDTASFDIENLDKDFLWNSYMINPLLQFRSRLIETERRMLDSSRILTSVIRGFVQSLTIPASMPLLRERQSNLPSELTLISRLSSGRAGTRFNSRGIDDGGNVSNFVETETILYIPSSICFSYTQIRGSVPIFWEQEPGLIPGQQKIQVARSTDATQPAFDKHFERLELDYGAIHVVNLLSASKVGEAELTKRFRYHVGKSPLRHGQEYGTSSEHHLLRLTEFDFHAETRGPAGYESATLIRNKIEGSAEGFAYFLTEDIADRYKGPPILEGTSKQSAVVLQQEGVFRTNCLDCLDRTNLVQTMISRMALQSFFDQQKEMANPDFWMRHSTLWADNGDNLSRIYAGTGALKSSFTRHGKMSLAGAFADARKSATRLYVNNFADKERQNTIDMLLGSLTGQSPVNLFDPVHDHVVAELNKKTREYSSLKTIRIWAGTFNLNGRSHGAREDLSAWLNPQLDSFGDKDPDIVAVGFQEIVELSPQQIMSTDPSTRKIWEEAVKRTLDGHTKRMGTSEYVLLRTGQLVGAALLIFIKAEALPHIKNVEGSVKKTGLSGMGGNKGGCAIRLEYSTTRICFVTAHLAAGFANYDERNRDYETISNGLRFQRNRSIDDHDTIVWLGDFNYRIKLSNDSVRKLVQMKYLDTLYENDQLNLQMIAGRVFPFYSEGPITFPPTYKYDNGTDTYDTSEKARTPAWCDRVLWRGTNLRQLEYNVAPLRFSDHRPVYAIFDCTIRVVDEALKQKLARELYRVGQNTAGNVTANSRRGDTDEEDLLSYDPIAPGLPPASSDRRKWWLDYGLPVRSAVMAKTGHIADPRRSQNPFSATPESDWVHIGSLETGVIKEIDRTSDVGSAAQRRSSPQPSHRQISPSFSLGVGKYMQESLLDTPNVQTPAITNTPRKRAPPVPAKPAQMSANRSGSSDPSAVDGPHPAAWDSKFKDVGAEYKPPLPVRRNTGGGISPRKGNAPPPVRSRGTKPQMVNADVTPSIPPRTTTTTEVDTTLNVSALLDNDVDENLASWKPLQPQG